MEQAIFLKKEQRQLKTDLHFDYCGISKTLPFHAFGPAIRQNYTLHIVMEGKGTYQVKNQQYHLKKGDLFGGWGRSVDVWLAFFWRSRSRRDYSPFTV